MRGASVMLGMLLVLDTATGVAEEKPDKGDADADPAATERAKRSYAEARALHENGEYQRAAAAYLAAYSDYADPELYFNAAQVYRLHGENALALGYYRRYLELDPGGRAAAEAREHVAALAPEVDGIEAPGSAADRWGEAPGAPRVRSAAPAGSGGSAIMRGSAVALGVGAAVSFGVAIAAGIEARGLSAELSTTERWTDDRLARFDEGAAAEGRAVTFTAIGAAAAVGAGLLWWLGGPETGSAAGQVAAGPLGGGGFAVSAGGRF